MVYQPCSNLATLVFIASMMVQQKWLAPFSHLFPAVNHEAMLSWKQIVRRRFAVESRKAWLNDDGLVITGSVTALRPARASCAISVGILLCRHIVRPILTQIPRGS